jgi:hypothetical protein
MKITFTAPELRILVDNKVQDEEFYLLLEIKNLFHAMIVPITRADEIALARHRKSAEVQGTLAL